MHAGSGGYLMTADTLTLLAVRLCAHYSNETQKTTNRILVNSSVKSDSWIYPVAGNRIEVNRGLHPDVRSLPKAHDRLRVRRMGSWISGER